MSTVYLNGEYLDSADATVSVFDRGFLFGHSVYEVVPVYAKCPFKLNEHLQRLRSSLASVDILLGLTNFQLTEIITKIINKNPPIADTGHAIYIQITRGTDETRNHRVTPNASPTIFVCSTYPEKPKLSKGLNITTAEDIRWHLCNIKATTLLANILINEQALAAGFDDVILFRNEQLTEAVASNVFLVKNGTIFTPKRDTTILGGITRDFVIEIAKENNFKMVETDLSKKDVFSADEIWLTSSNKEIAPVKSINGQLVSEQPGPVWNQMITCYHDKIRNLVQQKQSNITSS